MNNTSVIIYFLSGNSTPQIKSQLSKQVDLTLNWILLNANQYIYKCRLDQKPLSMNSYKNWIKTLYDIEKYIAYKKCDWNKFNDMWSKYKSLFQ